MLLFFFYSFKNVPKCCTKNRFVRKLERSDRNTASSSRRSYTSCESPFSIFDCPSLALTQSDSRPFYQFPFEWISSHPKNRPPTVNIKEKSAKYPVWLWFVGKQTFMIKQHYIVFFLHTRAGIIKVSVISKKSGNFWEHWNCEATLMGSILTPSSNVSNDVAKLFRSTDSKTWNSDKGRQCKFDINNSSHHWDKLKFWGKNVRISCACQPCMYIYRWREFSEPYRYIARSRIM